MRLMIERGLQSVLEELKREGYRIRHSGLARLLERERNW